MKPKKSSLLRKRQRSARVKTRYISELIQESTHAPAQDVPMIERIMRSDVFHSTLDWQSREQLIAGAREAHTLLAGNRDLYELEQSAAATLCGELPMTKKDRGFFTAANSRRGVAPGQ